MAKKVLSIVIGTEFTKVCEVSYRKNYKNKGIRVYRSISFLTPENSIEDGSIKDMQVFGEELRKQLKAAKIKTDKVIFTIASSKIANREIILPPTKEKKIDEIIKTGASDYFPIDIKNYIISYTVIEKNTSKRNEKSLQKSLDKKAYRMEKHQAKLDEKHEKKKSKTDIIAEKMEAMDTKAIEQQNEPNSNDNGYSRIDEKKKHMRINVYAVPSSLVKNYYTFAKAMHLDIVSIDYIGNSSYQMFKRIADRGTNVYVQLNEQDTLISILRDDTLILQRTISYGISMLTEALLDQDYYHVNNKEDALALLDSTNLLADESIKQGYSATTVKTVLEEAAVADELHQAADQSSRQEERRKQAARNTVVESLHFLTSSVARMVDYYKSGHKNETINKIYISGTGACIQGIDEFFHTEIGMQIKKTDRLWTVSANKMAQAYRKNPNEFISCIGAVIKPIDFVPKELMARKQRRSAIIATAMFTLICLAGSAGAIYVSYLDYQASQEELVAMNTKLASMPEVNEIYAEHDSAVAELNNLQQFDQETDSNNDRINEVINELENKLPTGTVIHTMQFSETGVSMSVTADDNNVGANAFIAKIYQQLDTIELFNSVDIEGIAVAQDEISSKISFTLTCTYEAEE